MCRRLAPQFGGLFLWRRIAQEAPAAHLWSGQVLQQVGAPQRRVDFDVEVKPIGPPIVRWSLVQDKNIRE